MTQDAEKICAAVEQRFAKVARLPDKEEKFAVSPASAKKLGYDPQEMDSLPPSVTESFCGVGNPLGPGELCAEQTVLDLGSGADLDSLLAARRMGPTGKVAGVDLCPEMLEKARHNASLLGLHNVEIPASSAQCLGRRIVSSSEAISIPLTECGSPVGR